MLKRAISIAPLLKATLAHAELLKSKVSTCSTIRRTAIVSVPPADRARRLIRAMAAGPYVL